MSLVWSIEAGAVFCRLPPALAVSDIYILVIGGWSSGSIGRLLSLAVSGTSVSLV